ncbi:N-acetylmuramoyl-L-alanine amidase [Fundicoccus culcitae]|uniref:N-acetylmuramoyl-L-alanine amidase n=1 Tax=Fundicoccus culcitae TaxID=2969821 RepID=A0ABY5P6H6_9LACT|nr:N-acetylmuramoyl-L-alanine amidase [Fundicoccus culcitae]UUX34332.1 N-acetylmuramoyl-L-alanine amidase [Fundicoccus culcitae]
MSNILEKIFSKKYFPPILTILVLLIGSLAIANLLSDTTIIIEQDNVVIRESAATNSNAIVELSSGDQVTVISSDNGWNRVRFGTYDGWIPQWLLDNQQLVSDQNIYAQILVNTPVYSSPDENSELITNLESGQYLPINYESNGWISVTLTDGVGYFRTRLVGLINPEQVPTAELTEEAMDEQALEAERLALQDIGVIRSDFQLLYDSPSVYADYIYEIDRDQTFTVLDIVTDDVGNEFAFVEDENGIRGYVEDRLVAYLADSVGHVGTTNPGSLADATILIDPGHGGEDPGAISYDELTYEKDVTLDTAYIIRDHLEALGAEVLMTRDDDSFVPLNGIVDISNQSNADVFISLHYDASLYPDWSGITTYYYHESDFSIADSINNELINVNMINNGTNFGNYHVIRENSRPAVLLELGYMSNTNDLVSIRSEDYRHNIAEAIVTGLSNYFDNQAANEASN